MRSVTASRFLALSGAFVLALSALSACTPTEEEGTPSPEPNSVTFRVDTTSKADGANLLAAVAADEKVYVVGPFTKWDPNNPDYALTSEGDGIYSLTLSLPHTGTDYDGNELVIDVGDTIDYKFAKTNTAEAWDQGQKDYAPQAERACNADPAAAGGLWEVGQSAELAAGANDLTVVVDAWRDTAEAYGYSSCD